MSASIRRSSPASTRSASCCRSASSPASRCAASPTFARSRRRRHPPDRLAEPADLRHRRTRRCRRRSARIEALGLDWRGDRDPRRPGRLHRQPRAASSPPPTPRAPRGRSPTYVRERASRSTSRSTSTHRLPPLLRPALHRRHRPDRRARAASTRTATRSTATTSWSAAASATTRRDRPRALPRREGRRTRPRPSSACSRAYLAHRADSDRELPRLRAAATTSRRCSAFAEGYARMTMPTPSAVVPRPILPENAPFSPSSAPG